MQKPPLFPSFQTSRRATFAACWICTTPHLPLGQDNNKRPGLRVYLGNQVMFLDLCACSLPISNDDFSPRILQVVFISSSNLDLNACSITQDNDDDLCSEKYPKKKIAGSGIRARAIVLWAGESTHIPLAASHF